MEAAELQSKSERASARAAVLLLLLMPAVAAFVTFAVQVYLGGGIRPLGMSLVASLALFIYALNGLSDGAEDTINDAVRASTLRRNALWTLCLSSAGLVTFGTLLGQRGEFHGVYALVLLVGVVYSFRIVPHPLGAGRPRFRLKDIPLVKNLSIGASWACAVFLGPVQDLDQAPSSPARVALVGVSYAVLVTVNSLFSDLRDEPGDRAAGVDTLAVRFGAERCFRGIFVALGLWAACHGVAFATGLLDAKHLLLLGVTALGYPLAVWFVVMRMKASQGVQNSVIESGDVVFALGMIALGSSR